MSQSIKSILVPVDGSEPSMTAVSHAAMLAGATEPASNAYSREVGGGEVIIGACGLSRLSPWIPSLVHHGSFRFTPGLT